VWRPDLGDFIAAASVVLDTTPDRIGRLPGLGLAESALAAPFAGFGDQELYSTLEQKAAVLLERLARNHPLPDGNKRVALALMAQFLRNNGLAFGSPDPAGDDATVRAVAAGELDHEAIVAWVHGRTRPARD
jgi:death-on-curing protein